LSSGSVELKSSSVSLITESASVTLDQPSALQNGQTSDSAAQYADDNFNDNDNEWAMLPTAIAGPLSTF